MKSARRAFAVAAAFAGASAGTHGQGRSVIDSPHNLSASGPGTIRAVTEEQVCIFCHTPHNATPVRPLWNRRSPIEAYAIYSSNELDAELDQPTGTSKMCLSCHDGTIALGSVVSRDQSIRMAGGLTTLPPGHSNLGTDLSDDHPISFRYDASLVVRDPQLVDPALLPTSVRLDTNGELQCMTCHDAHDNGHGDFLVMSNENSALCRSCHRISSTPIESHIACTTCHRPHTAPSGPYLLIHETISETCTSCHSGVDRFADNILDDLQRVSVHDTNSPVDVPDPVPGHVTCADCHEPHTMGRGTARALGISPQLGQIDGINSAGGPAEPANYEYEVCYKCHADANALSEAWVSRAILQINTRLEFDPGSISFHPIEAPGRSRDVPSLVPPWTTGSTMKCSDCHGSDTSRKAGGSGPDGVHGSNEEPLLLARYEMIDYSTESPSAYALCYRCHYREGPNGILGDRSFPHSEHVSDAQTPCSVCHDAHGIYFAQGTFRNNTHLINFDTRVVYPEPSTGRRQFVDTGMFSGSCTLACHGVNHVDLSYDQR